MFMAMKQDKTRLRVADIVFYGTRLPNYRTTKETKMCLEGFDNITLKTKISTRTNTIYFVERTEQNILYSQNEARTSIQQGGE
jgi:hypothetical protein